MARTFILTLACEDRVGVERVDHRYTESVLARMGRDIEAQVLARPVRWTAERRVFLNGVRTVVFS